MKAGTAILLALVSCGPFVRAEDATERLRSAVDAVPDGGIVRIEKGEYHFYAGRATKMTLSPSNNTRGEKRVLFPLVGRRDLTIDGGGSVFVLHDDVFPFAVTNCSGITLRNFTMKTFVPPVAEFTALAKTEEGALIEFSAGAPSFELDRTISLHSLRRLMIRYLMPGSSTEEVANLPAAFIRADLEPRDGRKAFLRYSAAKPRGIDYPFDVGERVAANLAADRDRLSFFFQDCSDVRVEAVRLPRGAGMGVVAQRCRNIVLRDFDVEPEEGEGVSLTADIVQLINCCGSVVVEDCEMSRSLDDAINIHGNYLMLESVEGDKVTLRTKHEQHAGFFPYRVGDELEFVEPKRRDVRAKAKVVAIATDPVDVTRVVLTLDREPAVEAVTGTIVENATLNPDVTIRNCRFRDVPHLRLSGRGRYLVENNLFVRCNEAVCAMDLADYWYESGRISDMTIRENTVIEGGGFRVGISGWNGDEPDLPKVHGKVVMKDNRFFKTRWQTSVSGAGTSEISGSVTLGVPDASRLVAHRGESYDAPENTLPAYRTAVERGFGFECDIYRSKDGRMFTFHDADLRRTTAGANTNRCTDVEWEDTVSKLNVGGWGKWRGSRFDPTRPALFTEVLDLARDGRWIYVEVKGDDPSWVTTIREELRRCERANPRNVLFISFGPRVCAELKRQLPEYRVYWLTNARKWWTKNRDVCTPKEIVARLREIGADGVDIEYRPDVVTSEFVKEIKDAGFQVHVWTVDDPDRAMQAFAVGAETLTTNRAKYIADCHGGNHPAADSGSAFPETRVFRTTLTQDFREVYNAEWSKLSTGPGAQIIDLDGAKATHRFRGLGGSFAECSGYLFSRMPETDRARLMEMLFGKTGLRLSTGRIHCASSDYSVHIYSYDDVDGDTELKHFSIDDDRRYVLPMIKAALKVNPDIFFFSTPWSAPWWMKTNRAVSVGHLRPDMYEVYSDYIVRFLQAYAEEGVDIKAHSPQNEPCLEDGPDVNAMNSPTMNLTPAEEAKLILTLKPRFDAAGLKTGIWMFDHNYDATGHVDAVLSVPGVREAVGGIAWHSYGGEPEAVARYRRDYPEFENIHTEQGPSVDRSTRDFLYWGERMLRGFNAGLSGYTNWLLLTDENGQPNTSCGHPCAGLVAVHSETGELIPSSQYQAFRHVSPYVMPGAEVLAAPPVNSVPGVLAATRIRDTETSAFRNPDGSHVVVINHRDDIGAQIVIRLHDVFLPVILLPKSLVTVVIR